jgi:hypothetical protein
MGAATCGRHAPARGVDLLSDTGAACGRLCAGRFAVYSHEKESVGALKADRGSRRLTQSREPGSFGSASPGAQGRSRCSKAPNGSGYARVFRFAREAPVSLIAVDEAHCCQMGQEFRPSTFLHSELSALPTRPLGGGVTATATPLVTQDIRKSCGGGAWWVTGFDPPQSPVFQPDAAER